jgi:hypothetical protein
MQPDPRPRRVYPSPPARGKTGKTPRLQEEFDDVAEFAGCADLSGVGWCGAPIDPDRTQPLPQETLAMPTLRRLILACALFACLAATSPGPIVAAGPTYLILQGPRHGRYSANPHLLKPQQYAYGWFGAQPRRRFTSRSHGYYGTYTQWSYR